MIPRCPGTSEYGHGLTRTTVHHGCCVEVLGHDLLRQGDRYVLTLDDGLRRTQFVVAPADTTGCGWHAWLSTPEGIDTVAHGPTALEAARELDRQLRALERLAEAVGARP
jgi:hypothetical protein